MNVFHLITTVMLKHTGDVFIWLIIEFGFNLIAPLCKKYLFIYR